MHGLASEGIAKEHMIFEPLLDMRYEGQSYEIITPFVTDFTEAFQARHAKTYGYRNDKPIQIVNIRLRARGTPGKPVFEQIEPAHETLPDAAVLGRRQIIFEGQALEALVFKREALLGGNHIPGPAVIVEYSSTAIVPPYAAARVDEFGNIIMDIKHDG